MIYLLKITGQRFNKYEKYVQDTELNGHPWEVRLLFTYIILYHFIFVTVNIYSYYNLNIINIYYMQ